VGQPVLSVDEGPHPENPIAKIGKFKQLYPKLLTKNESFFTSTINAFLITPFFNASGRESKSSSRLKYSSIYAIQKILVI